MQGLGEYIDEHDPNPNPNPNPNPPTHPRVQGLGEYIDEHDAVLRINDGPAGPAHDVGEKTTHRIMNRNKSIKACCNGAAAAALTPGTTLILWHPTDQV